MRTVFTNHELPHLWAHQSQEEGRNAGGTFYFSRGTIYSYRDSFPIARHVTGVNGAAAVLFTTEGYSQTTNGHKSRVRQACSHLTVFTVPELGAYYGTGDLTADKHAANLASYAERIGTAAMRSKRARLSWSKESHSSTALGLASEANRYADFFGLPVPDLDVSNLEALAATVAEQRRQASEAERVREEERRQKLEKERKAHIRKQTRRFREGKDFHWFNEPLLLRVREDDGEQVVETSLGAVVPLTHALRLLPAVRCGKPYEHNGHSFHVGPYRVDSIDAAGNLKIGCHQITRAEVERLAKTLNA